MTLLLKRTIKILSYTTIAVVGFVINSQMHAANNKTTSGISDETLNGALLSGIAHADLVGGGGYGDTPSGGGGGDCGDGGDGSCDGGGV